MIEIWKPVVGYEGIYEVSDAGRVRRIVDKQAARAGHVMLTKIISTGYRALSLARDGVQRRYRISILVARAFLGLPPEGHCINHKSGVKTDDRLSNLEYVTHARNTQHAFETGLNRRGVDRGWSKLNETAVVEIRRLSRAGVTQDRIARKFGVCRGTILDVLRGISWKHVPVHVEAVADGARVEVAATAG